MSIKCNDEELYTPERATSGERSIAFSMTGRISLTRIVDVTLLAMNPLSAV